MSSIYSKEQVLTNKHCSPNLKYINTVMSLELVIVSVGFEYWLFFERTEKIYCSWTCWQTCILWAIWVEDAVKATSASSIGIPTCL